MGQEVPRLPELGGVADNERQPLKQRPLLGLIKLRRGVVLDRDQEVSGRGPAGSRSTIASSSDSSSRRSSPRWLDTSRTAIASRCPAQSHVYLYYE